MKNKLLLCLALWSCNISYAQDLDQALRYLKVANTYREVDEYALAESFLNRSLNIITTKYPNQKYWEAAVYENLGLLFRDHDDPDAANRNFIKAIDIYTRGGFTSSVAAVQKLMGSATNKEEYFAGIDVGATGVKMSVMSVKLNPKTRKLDIAVAKKFKSANVNMGTKSINAYKEGAKAIAQFLTDSIAKYNISPDKIVVALSSGLVGRISTDTTLLKDEIRNALGNPSFNIDVVDYIKEAELTIRGAVPQSQWYTSAVIDIGSGNTKGGYYLRSAVPGAKPTMMGLEFPGTKSYASSIEKKYDPKDFTEYLSAIDNETKDLSLNIRREFDERRPDIKRRKTIYLLGGASYVSNVLMTPDSASEYKITMNKFAVNNLKKKAITDLPSLRNPDLSRITDPKKQASAMQKISDINTQIFPRDEDLVSAVSLVQAFMNEITRNIAVKEVVFLNGTDTAWINGLIRRNIETQYGRGNY
jgi:hypothetical protein